MFAELAIKHRVTQTLEWSAHWVEGRYYLEKWHDVPFAHPIRKPAGRLRPADTISSIDTACNNICSKHRLKSYSGYWDVVAWKQDAILFIESKHLNKDSIRDTQIRWLTADLSSTLTRCYFLIVEWLYEDEEPAADVSAHLLTQVWRVTKTDWFTSPSPPHQGVTTSLDHKSKEIPILQVEAFSYFKRSNGALDDEYCL